MDLITVAIAFVSILIGSIAFAYFHRKYSLNYWQSRNVPCIEPSFVHGNMENIGKTYHLAYALKDIYEKFKGTGAKYCGVYFWSQPVAFVLDLDLMKNIIIRDFNNFIDRGLYHNAKDDPLSANVATLDGDEWKNIRSKLSPAFTTGKIKYIFPTVVEVADSLNGVLKELVTKNDIEIKIKDFILRYTADVIGTIAFGIECNSLKNPNSEFMQMIRMITSKSKYGAKISLLLRTFPNIGRMLRIKETPEDMAASFMKMVTETVEHREKNNVRRNDVMDILISSRNQNSSDALTLNEIAANAFVFFMGGFDSSSTAMTSCFYELAMNPDIQTKAREMILKQLEKHNGKYTYEMLTELPYIEQVVKETLRKHPLAGSLNRRAKKDYPISGTNHVIEKGTWIKIPLYALHHDPEIYPDPQKFDPDRFESSKFRERHTWLPFFAFGEGPRGCIGQRLALLNMQIVVTMVLKDFELLPCAKTPKFISFNPKRTLLSPNQDIILKFRPLKL